MEEKHRISSNNLAGRVSAHSSRGDSSAPEHSLSTGTGDTGCEARVIGVSRAKPSRLRSMPQATQGRSRSEIQFAILGQDTPNHHGLGPLLLFSPAAGRRAAPHGVRPGGIADLQPLRSWEQWDKAWKRGRERSPRSGSSWPHGKVAKPGTCQLPPSPTAWQAGRSCGTAAQELKPYAALNPLPAERR